MATITVPIIELLNERRQFGSVNFVSSKEVIVTFANVFTSIPKVFMTAQANFGNLAWWAENVTTTGFTARLSINFTINFDWFAIQEL